MNKLEIENYVKAGKISQELRDYIKEIVKPDMKLVEIAEKVHSKIEELGAKPAFPVNLSIDDVAAHFHPNLDDDQVASGLLKVDFGIHVDGFIADSAISLDLTEDNRHKELIESVELALKEALELLNDDPTLDEIGGKIQSVIESKGFSPVVNLSGHSVDQHQIHSGITIPNYANGHDVVLPSGGFAIEPFATSGEGKIYSGDGGNIYELIEAKSVRSPLARKVLAYIIENYNTLPFSMRDIEKEFGKLSRLAMRELERNGVLEHHSMLIEKSHKPVAQAEHTFIKKDDGSIVVTTRG